MGKQRQCAPFTSSVAEQFFFMSLRPLLFLLMLAASSSSWAFPPEGGERDERPRFSPEQRRQMREQMREHWLSLTPEEREAHRARREAFHRLSPEERDRLREDMRFLKDDKRRGLPHKDREPGR